jgi:hypothetical protein
LIDVVAETDVADVVVLAVVRIHGSMQALVSDGLGRVGVVGGIGTALDEDGVHADVGGPVERGSVVVRDVDRQRAVAVFAIAETVLNLELRPPCVLIVAIGVPWQCSGVVGARVRPDGGESDADGERA